MRTAMESWSAQIVPCGSTPGGRQPGAREIVAMARRGTRMQSPITAARAAIGARGTAAPALVVA